ARNPRNAINRAPSSSRSERQRSQIAEFNFTSSLPSSVACFAGSIDCGARLPGVPLRCASLHPRLYAYARVRGLRRFATLLFIAGLLVITVAANSDENGEVSFTRGTLEIPTYTFSRSETVAPLFKSADGAALYPYARRDRDSMSRKPIPVRYESLTLENEYLRVTLLPELGGRIWSARDRVTDREIFYTTSVIKPTAYNQRRGWPVGNLEVYGPYDAHMRTWPSEAWPWAFRRDRDGGATVILSHIDHFFRNKLTMEVTLGPGRSFIELKLRLRNDNALPNRYLLWTNAGVR